MSEILATVPPPVPSQHAAPEISVTVRRVVGDDLTIESIEVPRDQRFGALVLRGKLTVPSHVAFARWQSELRPLGYTPMLRHDTSGGDGTVALHIIVGVPPHVEPKPWINVLLFVATVLSTLLVGALYGGELTNFSGPLDLLRPDFILQGWPFCATLLTILLAHEFGHYFAARFHNVDVTLPFFIPMPIGFGTLGAFIRFKEPVPDRRKLFDIGVAGPLAGLVVTIPLLFLGLSTSTVDIPPPNFGGLLEGSSVLYNLAKIAVFGKVLPNPITGEDVFMNQVAFAAWIGLWVTAMNLLPVGQLDGGHTVFALFGNAARQINRATLVVMGLLAIAGLPFVQNYWPVLENYGWLGWFLWLGLINIVIGPYHPPALDDVTELDERRRVIGYVVLVCLLITFVPVPLREI